MGPVRGSKRRKRAEKKVEARPSTAMGDHSRDWWDDFSRRMSGFPRASSSLGILLFGFSLMVTVLPAYL
ncbi:hypothetical protein KSP40_PGU000975 [Platanthera guangdongensis]|uniref:Uncharacterized protein n=1 Tax=Platanthera guangdongensis TaxID=2320717 RepID=A0ABR2MUP1_9ASPA